MSDRIQVTKKEGVADVKLVRTDKMNALDDAMFEALLATTEELANDKSVRCVVLSGEGRAFCAGLDMGNFGKMAEGNKEGGSPSGRQELTPRTHGITNRAQQAVWGWRALPVPVIAAVHGVALGGGFQVMLGADMRIIHPETKLSIMEIKWGLVPDMAGTAIMGSLCRDDRLRELTYTGRIFSGADAAEYGFATEVSETPYERAMELAVQIAGKNPDAIRANKDIFNNLPDMTAAEALLQESVLQDKLIGSKNQIEAIMAELQKRPAVFADS
ncbi:crotonase/enoyl-CoA hydratase family protein [Henriciella marina]|uniref:Crotonase/enoyl-CoA hydratase family protein n=1 Tax=Henriciella marina TaxID=453851 RepID=A0ABT4LU19_9PROT|nr:crotonase/enoyl-CoA hydratase family protein [Henriciella marina]MCZ4297698.1 crotonase/enoyl-CoA hydratase family protein [Henriciella marina]